MLGCVPPVREEQMVRICQYAYVCVAPPLIVGSCMVDGSNATIAS